MKLVLNKRQGVVRTVRLWSFGRLECVKTIGSAFSVCRKQTFGSATALCTCFRQVKVIICKKTYAIYYLKF